MRNLPTGVLAIMNQREADSVAMWEEWRGEWEFRPGTVYLNHGSFGPPPRPVRLAQRAWKDRLDEQPMDFFFRELPGAWSDARRHTAEFLGATPARLIFVENATVAMNIVAESFRLRPGDEILLTDHEYGAVHRIWQRRAAASGASCRTVRLPQHIETPEQVTEALVGEVSELTRLLVISHITSPTAITLPVEAICQAAVAKGCPVCVDGPHAIAQVDLRLDQLGCAFYTASCHKWLSAPFGSGFLYVAPPYQESIRPTCLSWGVLPPATPRTWDEEFVWQGTRDPTAYLAIPSAIQFLQRVGLDSFRRQTHDCARYARQRLTELTGLQPLVPDSDQWYGSMAHVPLPDGDARELQNQLWLQFGIEVPVVNWNERRWLRVSCHLYNREEEIDLLVEALRKLLQGER